MRGSPNPLSHLLRETHLLHFIVDRKMSLSPVDNEKQPCYMSLMILRPMSPFKFKE